MFTYPLVRPHDALLQLAKAQADKAAEAAAKRKKGEAAKVSGQLRSEAVAELVWMLNGWQVGGLAKAICLAFKQAAASSVSAVTPQRQHPFRAPAPLSQQARAAEEARQKAAAAAAASSQQGSGEMDSRMLSALITGEACVLLGRLCRACFAATLVASAKLVACDL